MTSVFVENYLQVGLAADQPANPETDEDFEINPAMLCIRFNYDDETFVIWNPNSETWFEFAGGSGPADTDDLPEGVTNFYYTASRFNTSFAAKSTSDLAEGSNLYFTAERAQDEVGNIFVDGTTVNFTYNDGIPSITAEVQAIATTHFAANVIDTDGTLAANSDTRLATQKAVKTFVTAAVGTPALQLITETVTSGSAASVSFSSIPATFRDLEIHIRGRGTTASLDIDIRMQFNGDTAGNYNTLRDYLGDILISYTGEGDTGIVLASIPAGSATANYSGTVIATIGDYRGTTFCKCVDSHSASSVNNTSGNTTFQGCGGLWRSTAAISAILLFPSAGAFVNGTVVSLYGRM